MRRRAISLAKGSWAFVMRAAAPAPPLSADARASMIHILLPWRGILPLPDAAIGDGDRAQLATLYRGPFE